MALDNYQEVKVTSCPEVIRSKTSGLQPKEPPKILGHKKETRPKRKRLLHCDKLSRDKFFLLLLLFLTSIPPTSAKSERPYSMVDEDDTRLGDDRPKMFVDYVRGPLRDEVQRFFGNSTAIDNFKIMDKDDNFLLIGATNAVYFLDTRTMREARDLRIQWEASAQAKEMCSVKGKSKAECQNHIRIVAKREKKLLLVCGTHAYRPKCRHYAFKEGRYVQEKEFEGIGITPFDPYHNSSFVIADGELYSATVSDFSASDPLIYKEPLRTDQSDSKHLNLPDFVKTVADGDYVFFFFREQAVEYINCGKTVYSRVARVCKSDQGGPNKYKNSWTSFLKSRLNCSLPGEYPFYFDHLQGASDIVQGSYGGQDSVRLIYAVFTTPRNSISGSAVCAFRLRDLLDTFEGAFKGQKIKEPSPRPGRCAVDSKTLPETTLSFVKGHSIMDEAVPAFFGGRPLFVKADLQRPSQFRAIAVDPQVRSPSGETFDVVFVATDRGRVFKIVNTASAAMTPTTQNTNSPPSNTLVEELVLFPSDAPILSLKVVRNSLEPAAKLIALTGDSAAALPLARCGAAGDSCVRCVALQDPYCAWDVRARKCTFIQSDRDANNAAIDSAAFIQSVTTGRHLDCGEEEVLLEEEEPHSRVLVQMPPEEREEKPSDYATEHTSLESNSHYTAEELSMAVATSCVCALVVGFVSGFLLARRCSCAREEENPYHVPYLNQAGAYQDDQIYAKVDDMTYYPVNNMLVSLPTNTNSTNVSSPALPPTASLPQPPPPPVINSKTLHHHQGSGGGCTGGGGTSGVGSRPADFGSAFGTVHRSQKIYL